MHPFDGIAPSCHERLCSTAGHPTRRSTATKADVGHAETVASQPSRHSVAKNNRKRPKVPPRLFLLRDGSQPWLSCDLLAHPLPTPTRRGIDTHNATYRQRPQASHPSRQGPQKSPPDVGESKKKQTRRSTESFLRTQVYTEKGGNRMKKLSRASRPKAGDELSSFGFCRLKKWCITYVALIGQSVIALILK